MSDFVDLPNIDAFDAFTGGDEWHSIYTIQLSELVESGVFDWSSDMLDWSSAAYDAEQYKRVCDAFIERFMWREISTLPPGQWMQRVRFKLVYELMPKYKPLYEAIAQGFNPLALEDEYHKRRRITSDYPETLLSGNADYISDGEDSEEERIKLGNVSEMTAAYAKEYQHVDTLILDALESLFVSFYTANVNGW